MRRWADKIAASAPSPGRVADASESLFHDYAPRMPTTFSFVPVGSDLAAMLLQLESRTVKKLVAPALHPRTSLQAQVHDKSGSADPLLGPDCTHPIYEIAAHDPLSLPLRLRRLPLVVLQQTAQPLPTPHRWLSISCCFGPQRKQNQILLTLVAALLDGTTRLPRTGVC